MNERLQDFEQRHPFAYGISVVLIFLVTTSFVLFASFSASLVFVQENPISALVTAIIYSCLSVAAIWFAWKCSPDRQQWTSLIKVLYVPLVIMITFTAPLLAGRERWANQHIATSIFVVFVMSSMIGLMIWHWRLRHHNVPKPDAEDWRTARYVVRGRFAPTRVVVFTVALAVGLAHLPLAFEVKRVGSLFGIHPIVYFGFCVFPLIKYIMIGLGQLYPPLPYLWADDGGIAVRNRFFIEWPDVDRLEIHRVKTKGGVFASGIDVFRVESKSDDYMTISFDNVQELPSDVLKQLMELAPTRVVKRSVQAT